MGYFQVRYDSRVVNYDRRGFIILATECFIFAKLSDALLKCVDDIGYYSLQFIKRNDS